MEETLRQPDEVWVNEHGGRLYDNFVMVKYYRDKAICVVGKVSRGEYTVTTWFEISGGVDRYKYRHGLLVYSSKLGGGKK
jgi:hypothetical protein